MIPHLDRIQTNIDFVLPLTIFALLVWTVWRIYRHDGTELPFFWRFFLPTLRTLTLLVLLWIYLQPIWVTERERNVNSRFIVFCDTSLSMMLPNENPQKEHDFRTTPHTRAQKLAELLEKTPFLHKINECHDIVFLAIDTDARIIETIEKNTLESNDNDEIPLSENNINWEKLVTPSGAQTCLVDGICEWLQNHDEMPISGVLLCSDGVQNSGSEMDSLINLAKDRNFPIFTIGFGSLTPIENYRLTEVEAPTRVLPHDPFLIRGTVMGTGFQETENGDKSHEIIIDLIRKQISEVAPDNDSNAHSAPQNPVTDVILDSQHILLSEAGIQTHFEFRTESEKIGKYLYTLRIRGGENEQNLDDNQKEIEIDVMERKTRVMIFAGGPMREYQFLTTALFRDKNIETDILLQSALPPDGTIFKNEEEEKALRARIQQDATRIIVRFPETREELFSYDCIVAIDANWKILTQTQAEWVEEWTARHGGGVIFIAGPVFMGAVGGWLDDATLSKIRTICPVDFYSRSSSQRQNTFTADEIWKLDWTQAGREASYLQLDDQQSTSELIWADFPGFYGHFSTKGLKHGATSLAHFSNPQTFVGDSAPILLATQFYGSGRTFFIGSGEFWRLRAQNPDYFTRFYTQIIQYVTQGRMLQQSQRGRLMIEKNQFFPGVPIEIRAQIYDSSMKPFDISVLPTVTVEAFLPNGTIQAIELQAEKEMLGTYTGRFSIMSAGSFRIELAIPDSEERLVQRGEVVISDIERDCPQRNQSFLNDLSQKSNGIAFDNTTSFDPQSDFQNLHKKLQDRTRTLVEFDSATPVLPPTTLMYILVSLFALEWFFRRVLKLA